ncbi:fibulin-1-like [Chironomus tepperi]|uniref:fibulin-1-like n=1 Tax=Chironomus tepperi TaxID=113505 RepID=UPI00391F6B6A
MLRKKQEEVILPDDEETDEANPDDDDYGDDDNDTSYHEVSSSSEATEPTTTQSEPTTTTQQTTTVPESTTTETTTTTIKPADYDEFTSTTAAYPTTPAPYLPPEAVSKLKVGYDSFETNEVDTATTTRRSPPKYRYQATTDKLFMLSNEESTTQRSFMQPPNFYLVFLRPENTHREPLDPSRFQASSRNSGNNPEPCGENRYCDHSCIIMHGVQKCSCNRGYILQRDGRTCLKADGSRLPPEEIRRTKKRCPGGHFLNDFGDCQDIDECRIQNNGCGNKAICRNTIGSYECIPLEICRAGYRYNEKLRVCEDINECHEDPKICEIGQVCNNTVGSYFCEDSFSEFKARCEELVVTTMPTTRSTTPMTVEPCYPGFERNYKGICVDIDECIFNPCEQGLICVNRNGGYTCEVSHCDAGFRPEGRACVDINECDSNPCPVTHNCVNTHGSYACRMKICPRGFIIDKYGRCEDVNECHIHKNLCRNADCINTNGSFTCNCKAGFRKDDNNYCRDINECIENIHDCSHRCVNKIGGYQCFCDKGYRLNVDQRTCEDIDECREHGEQLCQGECVNTLGSYECRCPAGFRKEESYCTDIDECQEYPGICDKKTSRCLNIPGSYKCMNIKCDEGYKLVKRNGERYCHLRTPCGDDDYDEDCNKPWLYSISFASRIANCTASNIFHLNISTHYRYDVVIEDVRAYSTKESIKKAGFDDFVIQKVSTGFFLASTRVIDGPQDIDIDVLVTFYRPDGSVEHRRGIKVKMVVSEFSFYKFSVRK